MERCHYPDLHAFCTTWSTHLMWQFRDWTLHLHCKHLVNVCTLTASTKKSLQHHFPRELTTVSIPTVLEQAFEMNTHTKDTKPDVKTPLLTSEDSPVSGSEMEPVGYFSDIMTLLVRQYTLCVFITYTLCAYNIHFMVSDTFVHCL